MFELIFHPSAAEELYALDPVMQAKLLRGLEKLEREGFLLRYPDSRALSRGLYELRVGGKDIARTFFAFTAGQRIFILRTFIKKTQNTPQREIAMALKRLEELSHGG
ncbi:type II toxin-antitoxin system RelE/ParE family toxin [Cronobacter dublinensis]